MDNKVLSYVFGGGFLVFTGLFAFLLFFIRIKNIDFGLVNLTVLILFGILSLAGLVLFYIYLNKANSENLGYTG